MAMILACGALLAHVDDRRAANASRAIYESVLDTVRDGTATSDLGGDVGTTECTDVTIAKIKPKLEAGAHDN